MSDSHIKFFQSLRGKKIETLNVLNRLLVHLTSFNNNSIRKIQIELDLYLNSEKEKEAKKYSIEDINKRVSYLKENNLPIPYLGIARTDDNPYDVEKLFFEFEFYSLERLYEVLYVFDNHLGTKNYPAFEEYFNHVTNKNEKLDHLRKHFAYRESYVSYAILILALIDLNILIIEPGQQKNLFRAWYDFIGKIHLKEEKFTSIYNHIDTTPDGKLTYYEKDKILFNTIKKKIKDIFD
ncbi:hypothetical protein [Seonamhaeicola aphaedonensis]|uniref:Uncharacterized protein n=1 Tax=Seonamhaeicola aphaedonensis TaxID=1461338 RepID=A0A3D9HH56_9FLAO|nr:hypothetical protein [Seonamhaeicola aphaedonensis]RED48793.1 hypothetical protein DFQ02_103123 [Seonamhaeicola aphaedonensis]